MRRRPAPTARAGWRRRCPREICGLTLVTGTGEVVTATETENPELLEFARLGLGALGVLTTITFRVEPLFVLEANETPMSWDEYVGGFEEHIASHHHVDTYWFPHTDRMLVKSNDRLDAGIDEVEPLSRLRSWWDDEFLSNSLFGALNHVTNRVPAIIPRFNQVSSRLLSARTYSDVAHKVFVSPRTVVFREMEYAVPLRPVSPRWPRPAQPSTPPTSRSPSRSRSG